MAGNGWIKLHRSIQEHWLWDCEFSYAQAWIDLLLNACHKPNRLMIKGQVIELRRGQQARSEVTLSSEWKWSRGKVRRFLNQCLKDGMIEQETTHLTSIISICNYDDFQSCDTPDDAPDDTPDGTSNGHLTVHKQEVKNLRIKEKDTDTSPCDEPQTSVRSIFEMMASRYMELIPEMPSVDMEANAKNRMTKAANFYKRYKFTPERWSNYLMAVRGCSWMMSDRPGSDGKTWRKKNFDFLITEKCYLGVREDRYANNDA